MSYKFLNAPAADVWELANEIPRALIDGGPGRESILIVANSVFMKHIARDVLREALVGQSVHIDRYDMGDVWPSAPSPGGEWHGFGNEPSRSNAQVAVRLLTLGLPTRSRQTQLMFMEAFEAELTFARQADANCHRRLAIVIAESEFEGNLLGLFSNRIPARRFANPEIDRMLDELGRFSDMQIDEIGRAHKIPAEKLDGPKQKVKDKQTTTVGEVLKNIPKTTTRTAAKLAATIFDQKLGKLPDAAPVLYKDEADGFKARKAAYRAKFREDNERDPFTLTDEDYTPVKFFKEVWGEYVGTGLLTMRYLEEKDEPLYQALAHFIRKAREGRPGRDPITFADLGILSERDVIDRVVHSKSKTGLERAL